MASYLSNIRKLQNALNQRGFRILYSTSQFFSQDQERPITMYAIKQTVYDNITEHYTTQEIFKTTSQIQILLYLRDMWFVANGWEIPTDNETWEKKKAELLAKGAFKEIMHVYTKPD